MEIITQGILGAAVSQVGFQRKLGRRAALWGAIIGMVPDADVLVGFMRDPFAEILYHRGFTHSLWFAPIFAPLFGYLILRYYQKKRPEDPGDLFSWIGLSFWALITHPLLDVFTIYGTQLLSPFSNFRYCFPSIPIIEPVYSLTLLTGILISLYFYKRPAWVCIVSTFTLLSTTSYLFYGLEINDKAENLARGQLEAEGVAIPQLRSYTTLFTMDSRRIVLQTPTETRIGHISVKDPKPIDWTRIPKEPAPYWDEIKKTRGFQIFDWFTNHDYFITTANGKLFIQDSRYGSPMADDKSSIWGLQGDLTPDNHLKGDLTWFKHRGLAKLLRKFNLNLLETTHAK